MPAVQTSRCLKPFHGKNEKLQVLFVFVFFPLPIMPQIPFSFSPPLSPVSLPSVYFSCPSLLPPYRYPCLLQTRVPLLLQTVMKFHYSLDSSFLFKSFLWKYPSLLEFLMSSHGIMVRVL